jgi:hypothetical protein
MFGNEGHSYTAMVYLAQREIDHVHLLPDLIINSREQQVKIGDNTSHLKPLEMVMLLHFAKRKLNECKIPHKKDCEECYECFEDIGECTSAYATLLDDYRGLISEKSALYQNLYKKWSEKGGVPHDTMRQNISKINRAIQLINDSPFYLIASIRKYGDTRYGIRLDRKRIRLVDR